MAKSPRVQSIAHNAVRITHAPPGAPIPLDPAWLKNTLLPLEPVESQLTVGTTDGQMHVTAPDGTIFFSEAETPAFGLQRYQPYIHFSLSQPALQAGLHRTQQGTRLSLQIQPGEHLYGWGAWPNAFGPSNAAVHSTPPLFLSSRGYGFLLLNASHANGHIDRRCNKLILESEGSSIDYLLIYGPLFKEILRTYTALTGRPALLPRWAFGLWLVSRAQSGDEIRAFVQRQREMEIPFDIVLLKAFRGGRSHKREQPNMSADNPQALIPSLKSLDIHLGLILPPSSNPYGAPGAGSTTQAQGIDFVQDGSEDSRSQTFYRDSRLFFPPQTRSPLHAYATRTGAQRYPALLFDEHPRLTFAAIRDGLRAGLSLSLAGFAYWMVGNCKSWNRATREASIRYAQWALLNPLAQCSGQLQFSDQAHNAQIETNFRNYAALHYRLLPYYVSLAHESYLTGIPLVRPMILEFQEDERLHNVSDQFMLGGALMVCPIVEAGTYTRKVILPCGNWYDFWSQQSWKGPAVIDYPAPLECIPLLVRERTVLPMGPALQSIGGTHRFTQLDYHIWPPYPSETIFFDEDSHTNEYANGAFSRTRVRAECAGNKMTVRISAAQGTFTGQTKKRPINVILHHVGKVESVSLDGKTIEWLDEASVVQIPFTRLVAKDTTVEVRFCHG